MGIGFDNVTMDEALSRASDLLNSPEPSYCVTPNSEIVYVAMEDEKLRDILNTADLVLPDGGGVVLASKILKTPLKQKVAGVDLPRNSLEFSQKKRKRCIFLARSLALQNLPHRKCFFFSRNFRSAACTTDILRKTGKFWI